MFRKISVSKQSISSAFMFLRMLRSCFITNIRYFFCFLRKISELCGRCGFQWIMRIRIAASCQMPCIIVCLQNNKSWFILSFSGMRSITCPFVTKWHPFLELNPHLLRQGRPKCPQVLQLDSNGIYIKLSSYEITKINDNNNLLIEEIASSFSLHVHCSFNRKFVEEWPFQQVNLHYNLKTKNLDVLAFIYVIMLTFY